MDNGLHFTDICLITDDVPKLVKFYEVLFDTKAEGDEIHSGINLSGLGMLVPHLHFGGRCEEAIELYKKAFDATVDTVLYNRDMGGDEGIGHAEMHIHG